MDAERGDDVGLVEPLALPMQGRVPVNGTRPQAAAMRSAVYGSDHSDPSHRAFDLCVPPRNGDERRACSATRDAVAPSRYRQRAPGTAKGRRLGVRGMWAGPIRRLASALAPDASARDVQIVSQRVGARPQMHSRPALRDLRAAFASACRSQRTSGRGRSPRLYRRVTVTKRLLAPLSAPRLTRREVRGWCGRSIERKGNNDWFASQPLCSMRKRKGCLAPTQLGAVQTTHRTAGSAWARLRPFRHRYAHSPSPR